MLHDHAATVAKAGTPAPVRENHAAVELELTEGDLYELDGAFPPPTGTQPPEMSDHSRLGSRSPVNVAVTAALPVALS